MFNRCMPSAYFRTSMSIYIHFHLHTVYIGSSYPYMFILKYIHICAFPPIYITKGKKKQTNKQSNKKRSQKQVRLTISITYTVYLAKDVFPFLYFNHFSHFVLKALFSIFKLNVISSITRISSIIPNRLQFRVVSLNQFLDKVFLQARRIILHKY